jgi:zinc protease
VQNLLDAIEISTLPNGLTLICLPKAGAPVVSAQIWYRTGSVNERDGVRGISHFFEHLMFRGSLNVRPEEHAQRINAVGGHCNAFTAEDVTAYLNSVPAENLDMVLGLEAERMQHLTLAPDVLETERKVIVEEFHTYMNNPVARAFLEFRREFYGSHPYSVSPLGTLEDIGRITLDDCRTYYGRWYAPTNAVLVVVGDVSHAAAREMTDRHFGSMGPAAGGSSPVSAGAQSAPRSGQHLRRRIEFDVPMQIAGYPAPPSSHPDALALDILQQVLSGGETSRLHRSLVRRQQVAVMAGGMNHMLRLSGMSLVFAAFTPDVSSGRVQAALDREVARLRSEGITADEMDKVKNATLASRLFEMYTAEHLCQRLGFSQTVEGDYRLWVSRLGALERLDREHLVDVARRYWDDSAKWTLCLQPLRARPMLYVAGLLRRLLPRPHSVRSPRGAA